MTSGIRMFAGITTERLRNVSNKRYGNSVRSVAKILTAELGKHWEIAGNIKGNEYQITKNCFHPLS
jgi:hypothetical protein